MSKTCNRCGAILDGSEPVCRACHGGSALSGARLGKILRAIVALAVASEAFFLAAVFLGHWGEEIPFARIVHRALIAHDGRDRSAAEQLTLSVSKVSAGMDASAVSWLPEATSGVLLVFLFAGLGYVFIYRSGVETGFTFRKMAFGLGALGFATFVDPTARIYLMCVTFNPLIGASIVAGLSYAFVEIFVLSPPGSES